MRSLFLVLLAALLLAPAWSQAAEKTRELKDPEGRITLTVPEGYKDEAISGTMIIHARAPGQYGGHILTVFREEGQGDVDKQRDRYVQHDSPSYPGADLRKVAEPWFGYRIYDQAQNRVLLRAFVSDGSDGIVIAVTSRLQYYDTHHAKGVDDIVKSISFSGGGGKNTSKTIREGENPRHWDAAGRVSLVAPAEWKVLPTEDEGELLFVALKGSKSGPRLTLKDWGGPSSASLILLRIFATWKRSYTTVQGERLGDDPPRMLVRDRVPGSVDFLIALEHRGSAYTVTLTVREGGFEGFRALAEDVARSVVFSDSEWKQPEGVTGDATAEAKGLAVVHADNATTADKVARSLSNFDKQWGRIGIGDSKKAPPLRIEVVKDEAFSDACHSFGSAPAAYDLSTRSVIVVEPPSDKAELAMWQGQLYGRVTEAILHRDVKAGTPAWLRSGLASLMDVAGRTGKGPEEPHPVFAKALETKTVTDQLLPLDRLLAMTPGDFMRAESLDPVLFSWGYCHLMIYGKTTLGMYYKRWIKDLEKAEGTQPPLDLTKYSGAEEDMKRHAAKQQWSK